MRFAELLDVVHYLFGEIHFVLAGLDIRALQSFDVVVTENGSPWLDFFDLRPERLQKSLVQHASFDGTFVTVVFVNIPSAKNKAVERGQRHEILDFRDSPFRPLTEAYGPKLRKRSDGLGDFLLNGFHTGDECRTHCTQSRNQNAQFSGRLLDFYTLLYHVTSWSIQPQKGTKITNLFVNRVPFCGDSPSCLTLRALLCEEAIHL